MSRTLFCLGEVPLKLPCFICYRVSLFLVPLVAVLIVSLSLPGALQTACAQGTLIGRARGREMLKTIKTDLKNSYYDASFRGIDVDSAFRDADQRISEAGSTAQILDIIARFLAQLNDPQTFFIPPPLEISVEYGWRMQMIGDNCYVTTVKSGSDAEAKGLKAGDLVKSIDGFEPTRDNFWKFEYSYYVLVPVQSVRLVTEDPKGQVRQIQVLTRIEKRKEPLILRKESPSPPPPECHAMDNLTVCRLREFDLNKKQKDEMMKTISQCQTLILDLRGTAGGSNGTTERLIGYFFDHDIKIGDSKRRTVTSTIIAKTQKDRSFKGKLLLLVDGKTASGAEVFARVLQIEKRGVVIGDRTAGEAMDSRHFLHPLAQNGMLWDALLLPPIFYGASITVAELVMSDGRSIEGAGVKPDIPLLPNASDIAAHRDPVLSGALEIAGLKLDAEKAGALFTPAERP